MKITLPEIKQRESFVEPYFGRAVRKVARTGVKGFRRSARHFSILEAFLRVLNFHVDVFLNWVYLICILSCLGIVSGCFNQKVPYKEVRYVV